MDSGGRQQQSACWLDSAERTVTVAQSAERWVVNPLAQVRSLSVTPHALVTPGETQTLYALRATESAGVGHGNKGETMQERMPCLGLPESRYGCDYHVGHEGPCSDAWGRERHADQLRDEIRQAQTALVELETGHRPRNRAQRRAAGLR